MVRALILLSANVIIRIKVVPRKLSSLCEDGGYFFYLEKISPIQLVKVKIINDKIKI